MTAILPRSVAVSQPRGTPRINRSNRLTQGALVVVSAADNVNAVNGSRLIGAATSKLATPSGIANAFRNATWLGTGTNKAIGTASFVEFWHGRPTSSYGNAGGGTAGFVTGGSAGSRGIFTARSSSATQWGFLNGTYNVTTETLAPGVATTLVVVRRQATTELWRDGKLVLSFSAGANALAAETFVTGALIENTPYWDSSSDTILAGQIVGEWSAAEVQAFSANPWQLFEAEAPRSYASAIAAVAAPAQVPGRAILPRSVADRQPRNAAKVRKEWAEKLSLVYVAGQDEVVGANLLTSAYQAGTRYPTANGIASAQRVRQYAATAALRPTTAVTVVAVLSLDGPGGTNERIYSAQEANNGPYQGYGFYRDNTGKIHFGAGDASGIVTEAVEPTAVNGQHVYVGTFDGKTVALYRDGALVVSLSRVSGISYTANALPVIGAYITAGSPVTSQYLRGGILAIGVWAERAFSANEAAAVGSNPWQLFESEAPRSYASAIAAVAAPAQLPGRAILPRQFAEKQPRDAVKLNRRNPLTTGALAIISSSQDVNVATGVPLTKAGNGQAKNPTSKGLASKFRNNNYLATEVLPAIGTGAFVEFWHGVPIAYAAASGGTENAFLTGGSTADGTGIALAGGRGGAAGPNWSVTTAWAGAAIDSGEVIPLNVPTTIVRVRRADGSTHDLWRDGRLVKSALSASSSIPAKKFIVGSFVEDTAYWTSSSDTILAGIVQGEWTAAQVKSFCANPWQLFESEAPRTYASAITAVAAPVVSVPGRAILPRSVAVSQPRGTPRINKSHPLTRGIVDAWMPGVTSRGVVTDADSSTVAGGSVKPSPVGVGFNTTATGRRYSSTILNGQPVAWLIVASRDNSAGQNASVIRKDGSISPMQEWDGQTRAGYFAQFTGYFVNVCNYGPTSNFAGKTNTFCGIASTAEQVIFANGDPNISTTFVGPAASIAGPATNPFCIGATESGSEVASTWTVHLVVMWQGATLPTSSQLRALSANPWQLFESEAPRTYASAITAVAAPVVSVPGRAILPRSVAVSQPRGTPRINRNLNPAFLISATGGAPVDHVQGVVGVTMDGASAAPLVGVDQTGQNLKFNGVSKSATFPSNPAYNILGPLTLVWYGTITDYANYNMLVTRAVNNGGGNNPFELRTEQSTGKVALTRSSIANTAWVSAAAVPTGTPVVVIVTQNGDLSAGTANIVINGVGAIISRIGTGVNTAIANSEPLYLGRRADGYYHKGSTSVIAGFPRILSDAEIAQISANPWQLFESEQPRMLATAPGVATATPVAFAADLVASAAVVASASAALTARAALAANSSAAAGASASLSAAANLQAAAVGVATTAGALSVRASLSASLLAQAFATAGLSAQASLAASPVAMAAATAGLSAPASLAASPAALAGATAALSTTAALSAAAAAQATVGATLSAGQGISATAAAVASVTASLSARALLAAQPAAAASVTAALNAAASLSASPAATAAATAALVAQVALAAAPAAQAAASGALSTQANLAASAAAQAFVTANLSAGQGVSAGAVATASVSASLSTRTLLAAQAAAVAVVAANMSSGQGASANAVAVATVTANLSVGVGLSAGAVAVANAAAQLSTAAALSASPAAAAAVTAGMQARSLLLAGAVSAASVTAGLQTAASLSAAAVAGAPGAAPVLTAGIGLGVNIAAQASVAANLRARVDLSASAQARASVTGTFVDVALAADILASAAASGRLSAFTDHFGLLPVQLVAPMRRRVVTAQSRNKVRSIR